MKPSMPLMLLLLALAYAAAVSARYVPIEIFARSDGFRVMRHTPQQTYRYARDVLAAYGGLPADAQPRGGSQMREGGGLPPQRIADVYEWTRRDLLGSSDYISIEIAERADGRMYPFTIIRHWQPRWLIDLNQWNIRRAARPLPAFATLRSSCPHGTNGAAVARVLGSPLWYLPFGGIIRKGSRGPQPPSLASQTAALVTWPHGSDATLGVADMHYGDDVTMQARAAWVSDGPPGERFRRVMAYARIPSYGGPLLYENRWHWLSFASADIERVCR